MESFAGHAVAYFLEIVVLRNNYFVQGHIFLQYYNI